MCTAISVKSNSHYFGRNLDYEHTFGQSVVITPRRYVFNFLNGNVLKNHYALIGIGLVCDNYPLYFDCCNEKGLCMAGLNFPKNAVYNDVKNGRENVASFELLPFVLSQCETVNEARLMLENINITNRPFNSELLPTPLHWIVSDKEKSITLEQTKNGLKIYENPVGVLTNNPPFDVQMFNLSNYMNVSANQPKNNFSDKITLTPYSNGMGGMGLPGDLSSASRFVRSAFIALNTCFDDDEYMAVNTFFHILYSVYQQKGCVVTPRGLEFTNYSSCYNAQEGVCYYTTYNNSTINAVSVKNTDVEGEKLMLYNMIENGAFNLQN